MMRAGRRIGPADDDSFSARGRPLDDFETVLLLRHHAAGQDNVRPIQIGVRKLFDVLIDEPDVPVGRQQRGYSAKSKRRRRIVGVQNPACLAVVPERRRTKFRVYQQRARHMSSSIGRGRGAGYRVSLIFREHTTPNCC